jgi:tRNA pseudouridine55 synthase
VVQKVKYILSRGAEERVGRRVKIKVGHGGTLDPLAEGVLVLGVGQGTKLMADFLKGGKGYRATARLGFETNTLDCTGNVTTSVDSGHVTRGVLESHLPSFMGDTMQVPPMFSALKKDGKRLYELARQGKEVERAARPVAVAALALTEGEVWPDGHFRLEIESSGGFYVRTLIEDLARLAGGAAHMTALLRTKQGPFLLDDCLAQPDWSYESIVTGLHQGNARAGLAGLRGAVLLDPTLAP